MPTHACTSFTSEATLHSFFNSICLSRCFPPLCRQIEAQTSPNNLITNKAAPIRRLNRWYSESEMKPIWWNCCLLCDLLHIIQAQTQILSRRDAVQACRWLALMRTKWVGYDFCSSCSHRKRIKQEKGWVCWYNDEKDGGSYCVMLECRHAVTEWFTCLFCAEGREAKYKQLQCCWLVYTPHLILPLEIFIAR